MKKRKILSKRRCLKKKKINNFNYKEKEENRFILFNKLWHKKTKKKTFVKYLMKKPKKSENKTKKFIKQKLILRFNKFLFQFSGW